MPPVCLSCRETTPEAPLCPACERARVEAGLRVEDTKTIGTIHLRPASPFRDRVAPAELHDAVFHGERSGES